MDKMFEEASRVGLRFATAKGALTVEDLWNLPLQASPGRASLDAIAIDLHKRVKESAEIASFVDNAVAANAQDKLGFELVKYIIGVRVAEREAAKAATVKAQQKQRIMELLAQKQDQALMDKSADELEALLKAM